MKRLYILNTLELSKQQKSLTSHCTYKMVVSSSSGQEARKLAASYCGDEGPGMWLDPGRTLCRIAKAGKEDLVCRDFRYQNRNPPRRGEKAMGD